MEKANHTAEVSDRLVDLPMEATFDNGGVADNSKGGILTDAVGVHYSLAHPTAVQGDESSMLTTERHQVLAKRLARIPIHTSPKSLPPTFGFELEYATLDEQGNYAPNAVDDKLPELYRCMGERGSEVVEDASQLEQTYSSFIGQLVQDAEEKGQYVAALSVFGQREFEPHEQNPAEYIAHTAGRMEQVTEFNPRQIFRIAGLQPHTSISNTEAAIIAAEAKQYLNPILAAPSSAGPFLHGGLAGKLATHNFTKKQYEHLQRVGLAREDLSTRYHSWRYLLRRLGSPAGGLWHYPAPENLSDYFSEAEWALATGAINSIDRLFGLHTDRIRSILDQSGASTLESSSYDTFLGNPQAMASSHLLDSAIFTRLESMALKGDDPREAIAKLLGIAVLRPADRLKYAHRMSLSTARQGNDALVYKKNVSAWLPHLLAVAEDAPHIRLSDTHRSRLQEMYASSIDVNRSIDRWRTKNRSDSIIHAYFDQPVGSPSIYMRRQYRQLKSANPRLPEPELIRLSELYTAKALHRVGQFAVAA